MAEEHGFQSPDGGHRLCVNNCGFFGSPATQNLCSKCYRDLCLKNSGDSSSSSLFSHALNAPPLIPLSSTSPPTNGAAFVSSPEKVESAVTAAETENSGRCSCCRKKVGLTGFRCRCGMTYCGTHRYPEKHECPFDFKALGREAIAKANPVVKADKLGKI